tara:strand:- start:570 stop:1361 length:792 start_codon:yes stop_codon:yes gene_type:complete
MQLKKIKVYGRLRKFLGSSYFEAAVSSPAEAIRFLLCNFPKVEKHMCEQYYKIKMNNSDISIDFVSMKGKGDIQIIPVATGSGFVAPILGGIATFAGSSLAASAVSSIPVVGGVASAAVKIVGATVGTNQITNAIASGTSRSGNGAVASSANATAGEFGSTANLGSISSAVVSDTAIDGVSSLVAPTPEITPPPIVEATGVDPIPQNDTVLPDQRAQNSFGFSAITNISRAGVAVPIIYGEVFTGSIVISAGIDTVQIEGTAA